jgi:hypothetical protein
MRERGLLVVAGDDEGDGGQLVGVHCPASVVGGMRERAAELTLIFDAVIFECFSPLRL